MKYKDIRIDHRIILGMIEPHSAVLDLGCGTGELISNILMKLLNSGIRCGGNFL